MTEISASEIWASFGGAPLQSRYHELPSKSQSKTCD